MKFVMFDIFFITLQENFVYGERNYVITLAQIDLKTAEYPRA